MFSFLVHASIISLSGVMAPGPITASVIHLGRRNPFAGSVIAIGHGLIEIPLMILILVGLHPVVHIPAIRFTISLLGGVVLLWLGVNLLRSLISTQDRNISPLSPMKAGIVLSASNPYFLLWWVTVGASLLISSKQWGIVGVVIFALIHWLCDLIWYQILSAGSHLSDRWFGPVFYRGISLLCALCFLYFGAYFIFSALT